MARSLSLILRAFWAAAFLAVVAPAAGQSADFQLHSELGGDLSLNSAYSDRFSSGFHGIIRGSYRVTGPLSAQLGVGAWWFPLLDGRGVGRLTSFELGLRYQDRVGPGWIGGPAADLNLGYGLTGDLERLTATASLGWAFRPFKGFYVGPQLRYLHIFQPDSEIIGADGQIAMVGLFAGMDLGGARSAHQATPPALDPAPIVERASPAEAPVALAPADADQDGIPDSDDRCPAEAEDFDAFADSDGCPDRDNDGDGVADAADRCPGAAEVFNGLEDEDGCPDALAPVAARGPEVEALSPAVYFVFNGYEVTAESRSAVSQVCAVAKSSPDTRVQVIGYADDQGAGDYNHQLSAWRAGAVARALIRCGVPARRIDPIGRGVGDPVCDEGTRACRRRNRRVEFKLVRGAE